MNLSLRPIALAMLVATTQLAVVAYAEAPITSVAVQEDKAQLQADEFALAREKAQLKIDRKTLKSDSRSGRMAAESPDAERIYKDGRYIRAEKRDLASDKPGSLQKRADKTALLREEAQLTADLRALNSDTRSGRMAAESSDAERVYKDQQAVKGQHNAISADKASLKTDQKP